MVPDEQRAVLDDLNVVAIQNIGTLWRNASAIDLGSAEFRDMMIQGVPEIVSAYSGAAGDLAATWYDDAAPSLSYLARPAELAPSEQLEASTSWALSANGDAALTRMAGFTSRAVFDAARRTTVENALNERGATWARHARAGSCSFCRLLATRAEVYASKASATAVGGRKGRTRGTQGMGEKYHDHCRCTAVAVRPGQVYTPPDYVAEWDEQYNEAVQATSDGGPINLKAVLAKMDELEGGRRSTSSVAASQAALEAKKVADAGAWLAAEKQYSDDVTVWLNAEKQFSLDTKKRLAAERSRERAAAEARRPDFEAPAIITEDEGREAGHAIWHEFADGLGDTERKAVLEYTGSGFKPINLGLRGSDDYRAGSFENIVDASMRAEYLDTVKVIDRVIDAAPRVPETVRVSRAVSAELFDIDGPAMVRAGSPQQAARLAQASAQIGRVHRDDGFMSTSLQSVLDGAGTGDIELRLDVPAGTRGIYVSSHGRTSKGMTDPRGIAKYGPEENELMLGRGTAYEIYKVEERSGTSNGIDIVLYARIVEQNAARIGGVDG